MATICHQVTGAEPVAQNISSSSSRYGAQYLGHFFTPASDCCRRKIYNRYRWRKEHIGFPSRYRTFALPSLSPPITSLGLKVCEYSLDLFLKFDNRLRTLALISAAKMTHLPLATVTFYKRKRHCAMHPHLNFDSAI